MANNKQSSILEQRMESIREALKSVGRYSGALEMQIYTLASAMLTLSVATEDIARLSPKTRWCGDTLKTHPAFNVQRYAWDSVTRQLKALGLHTEQLGGEIEEDPLVAMTQAMIDAGGEEEIVRPDPEGYDR